MLVISVVIFWPEKTKPDTSNPAVTPKNPPSTTGGKRPQVYNIPSGGQPPSPKEETLSDNNDDDNDGVPNKDDKCPDKKGIPALEGCPEEKKYLYPKGGVNEEGISSEINVTVIEGIAGRKVVNRPKMMNDTQNTGRVAVRVCINDAGEVTSATYTQLGSTTFNLSLRKRAELWARSYRFVASNVILQCGTITFDFRVK
ncbi:MAG: hypothetical protein L6Q97_16955 [Thermoanaerobaculia bacterium]|nr:hypothetical protein [Thermoanaerobaculia bacterium]